MISKRTAFSLLLGFFIAFALLSNARAEETKDSAAPTKVKKAKESDGPVTLIITYRAKTSDRVAFSKALETEGAARFEGWKRDGVFSDYRLLFSTFAGSHAGDLFAVIRFAKFSDSLRWQAIEHDFPGGLSPETAKLASVEDESFADSMGHGQVEGRDSASAIFLVIEYDVTADNPTFKKFVNGHGIPQFKIWQDQGVITSYNFYLNESAIGVPWTALLVLEYKDISTLARREEVKDEARKELAASDPDFPAFAAMTSKVRKEKGSTTTHLIVAK